MYTVRYGKYFFAGVPRPHMLKWLSECLRIRPEIWKEMYLPIYFCKHLLS